MKLAVQRNLSIRKKLRLLQFHQNRKDLMNDEYFIMDFDEENWEDEDGI